MRFFLLLLLVVLSLSYSACKKTEENPVKINPCLTKAATSADFDIIEDVKYDYRGPYWRNYACDTVIYRQVLFSAKQDSCEKYEWIIGRDTLYGKNVRLYFGSRPKGIDIIPVKLTVTRSKSKIDTACFPNDIGVAIFTKNLVFKDIRTENNLDTTNFSCTWRNSLVAGTYYGSDSINSTGNRVLTIRVCDRCPDSANARNPYYPFTISSLNNCTLNFEGCAGQYVFGYKQMIIRSLGSLNLCTVAGSFLINKTNDSINIRYSYYLNQPGFVTVSNVWKGKRIK